MQNDGAESFQFGGNLPLWPEQDALAHPHRMRLQSSGLRPQIRQIITRLEPEVGGLSPIPSSQGESRTRTPIRARRSERRASTEFRHLAKKSDADGNLLKHWYSCHISYHFNLILHCCFFSFSRRSTKLSLMGRVAIFFSLRNIIQH